MDNLLNNITGLVGICLLSEPDDSTDDVSNESYEDKDSEEIIIVFGVIRTRSFSLIAYIRTVFGQTSVNTLQQTAPDVQQRKHSKIQCILSKHQ